MLRIQQCVGMRVPHGQPLSGSLQLSCRPPPMIASSALRSLSARSSTVCASTRRHARRHVAVKASQTAEPSAPDVEQDWTIRIVSAGTGAVDDKDDGRRLRLALLDENGHQLYAGSTDGAQPWAAPSIDIATKSWSRTGSVTVHAPAGATPAVLKIEKMGNKGDGAVDYLVNITISCNKPGMEFTTDFTAQKWIASMEAPGTSPAPGGAETVLFAATRLPQQETSFVLGLRASELARIRGEADAKQDPNILTAKRHGAENIYDYQTYNDLGKADMPRPSLGGPKWPYPRRLATHLKTEANNGSEQIGEKGPWLPFDERFNFTKKTDFDSGTVSAAVPAIFSGIGHLTEVLLGGPLLGLPGLGSRLQNYQSFQDVAEHYSYDALPSPLAPDNTTAAAPAAPPPPSSAIGPAEEDVINDLGGFFIDFNSRLNTKGSVFTPRMAGDEPPEPGFGKVAVSTLLKMAAAAIMGNLKGQMKKPRVLQKRPTDICSKDEEFGRQMLAGFNPSVIKALKEVPSSFGSAITEDDVRDELGGESMESLVAAANAGETPRLYWVDYWDFTGFFTQDWKDKGKVLHAGRAILYLQQDKDDKDVALVPIAIELAAHPNSYNEKKPDSPPEGGVVFSRSKLLNSGQQNMWELAKLVFRSLDVGYHQLISHWLRCHAAMEPFLIAMKRTISSAHPVYKLMLPHFRYTMAINASARSSLINADGVIEKTFAAGEFAMRLSSVVYKKSWKFKNQALPDDLEDRGMVNANGDPFLDYPYAEDGLRIWKAMQTYFTDYCKHYYGSGAEGDAQVVKDTELQAWWKDVTTKAHPDVSKDTWGLQDPAQISTSAELVRVLVTIAWTASAHHAAVNFGQYDYTSWPLNAPSLIRKPIPRKPADKEWKDLVRAEGEAFEKQLLNYINSPITNLLVAVVVNLLSTHSQDEHLLNEENTLLTDEEARKLNDKFVKNMQALEEYIIRKHNEGSFTRSVPGAPGTTATYSTCLIPGSAAGLTMRGVPYSVSI